MENMHTSVPVNGTETLERRRESISKKTTAKKKSELGQFMTAAPIAEFMAGLFGDPRGRVILPALVSRQTGMPKTSAPR